MTVSNAEDIVRAATSVARDAAEGRLSPAGLEQQAVAECRELFGTVAGEGDPLWALHVDIARQVLALDGVPVDELSEWAAVARQRAGQPVGEPDPAEALPEPVTPASEAVEPEAVEPEPVPEVEPQRPALAVVEPAPQRRAGGYDPLAGWDAGGSRR